MLWLRSNIFKICTQEFLQTQPGMHKLCNAPLGWFSVHYAVETCTCLLCRFFNAMYGATHNLQCPQFRLLSSPPRPPWYTYGIQHDIYMLGRVSSENCPTKYWTNWTTPLRVWIHFAWQEKPSRVRMVVLCWVALPSLTLPKIYTSALCCSLAHNIREISQYIQVCTGHFAGTIKGEVFRYGTDFVVF